MKKPIILILSLVTVVLLGWYAVKLINNRGKSDQSSEMFDFAVNDIESVDKVIITDKLERKYEIIKKADGDWTNTKGECITQDHIEFILDAFKNIEFKGYLPENAKENYLKIMASQHIKVEIFQNGEWTKSWYIGTATPDHYGQVMLLETAENGKSDNPVMMKIKGMNGIIDPRFFADERKWRCTNIFKLGLDEISKVDVKFNDEPKRSFTVTKKGTRFDVYQQGKKLPSADTSMILRYLSTYQKVHYEEPNYELTKKQIDSLKKTTPFCILTVTEVNNKSTKLKLFRLVTGQNQKTGMGEVINMDRNKLWVQLPSGDIVKAQYFVFNHLLLGNVYFPSMDLSGLKTHDGILPIEE